MPHQAFRAGIPLSLTKPVTAEPCLSIRDAHHHCKLADSGQLQSGFNGLLPQQHNPSCFMLGITFNWIIYPRYWVRLCICIWQGGRLLGILISLLVMPHCYISWMDNLKHHGWDVLVGFRRLLMIFTIIL